MVTNSKSFLGQKSSWTKVSLDNCPLDIWPLGKRSPWTTVPWTNVATPIYRYSNPSVSVTFKMYRNNCTNNTLPAIL